MAGTRNISTSSRNIAESERKDTTYEEIMGIPSEAGRGLSALSARLVSFREWLSKEAKVTIHPSLCIVNGEATDGTKNAPVLVFGPPPEVVLKSVPGVGRCGLVDKTADQALYDRTMGCQLRAAREIKKGDVIMTVPRAAMITPDLIASSDAGRAVLACCRPRQSGNSNDFWDVFENTAVCEKKFLDNVDRNNGTQLLVKILQERKKAEAAFNKANVTVQGGESNGAGQVKVSSYDLAASGTISTRAPVLAFLIHQRFSNEFHPPVASQESVGLDDTTNDSALQAARRLDLPPDAPATFGPYARTLPSSVAVPICWKRNELALLAGCIPGLGALQEVTARTLQLAAEFIALLRAGLTQRFPKIFPPGLITWERWMWAAAVFGSRALPVSCYLNKGEKTSAGKEVWDELGVMIPFLDMLNHETDASQVTWQPCVPETDGTTNGVTIIPTEDDESEEQETAHSPRAIVHKRVKKGTELFMNYGIMSNQDLILQYGFAQVGNTADEVKIGWGLSDAVGNIAIPSDYSPPSDPVVAKEVVGEEKRAPTLGEKDMVYDCLDAQPINEWWTEDRLSFLGQEALMSDSFLSILKSGKKTIAVAYGDGTYYPMFLAAAVIGTMPPSDVKRCLTNRGGDNRELTRKHQEILRKYLQFFYSRKMEKMLQNLNNGLKGHFSNVQLWTRVSNGGLQYNMEDNEADVVSFQGWQSFFDSNAYATTTEVENRYYALGSDSCVLTMYDGQLRALQASIDGVSNQEAFEKGVLQQLKELDFVLLESDAEIEEKVDANGSSQVSNIEKPVGDQQKDESKGNVTEQREKLSQDSSKSGSKNNRRRNRRKNDSGGGGGGGGDRAPAIKLHIGNLAFTTQPSDLFDYFSGLYGRENILECHIPIERDSGRSRGFGFVTMPDEVANKVLQSGRKHEISGRLLKVAESNSAGGKGGRGSGGSLPNDRCATCGYRPRYCVCPVPDIPRHDPTYYYGDEGRAAPEYPAPYRDSIEYDYHGSRPRKDPRGSYSRSPSYHRSASRGDRGRDREYGWDYDRDYDRDRDRDYRDYGSRSYSRGGDRDPDRGRRDRDRPRGRSRDRSREKSRSPDRRHSRSTGESRGYEARLRRYSRSRSADRSRSRSGERSSRRDRKSGDAGASERGLGSRIRSPDRSVSPNAPRVSTGGGSERKRDSGKRSRSRSRGKSGKRRKSSSNKKDGSRRRSSRSRSSSPRVEKS